MENKPNRIIWHHSADSSNAPQFEKINQYHKTRKFTKSILGFYGGYHILIERDGTIKRYRNDNEIGCHDADENVNSLGICLAGNYSLEVPSKIQSQAFLSQINEWVLKYNIPADRIEPHRFGDATECPGKLLPDNWHSTLHKEEDLSPTTRTIISLLQAILAKLDNYCRAK